MKLTHEDVLLIIKELFKKNREPLTLNYIHNNVRFRFKDAKPNEIGKQLKYLHQTNKIEMIGDKIRPKSD